MSFPFRHTWPKSGEQPEQAPVGGGGGAVPAGEAVASEPPAQCPMSRMRAAGQRSEHVAPAVLSDSPGHVAAAAAAAGGGQQSAGAAGKCPFLAGMSGVAVATPEAAREPSAAPQPSSHSLSTTAGAQVAQPAVCPLGFGGGQQRKLGEFHCLICRALYHDCAVTSCGHRYCSGCMRGVRDCPICGADVTGLTPDPDTQALVDRYIEAHAGNHTIWELEGSGGQEADGMAGERSRAAFLLQLGLRAIAAGNTASARDRFQQCREDLQRQLEAAQQQQQQDQQQGPDVASLHCRLGAVCGCLGDCCRAEGDADGTLALYRESVELLQAAGQDPEAQQALSVALNKVGELYHLQGDLGPAAEHYDRALQLRRDLLAATQQQWHTGAEQGGGTGGGGGGGGQQAGEAATGAEAMSSAAGAEGQDACCSATLDLAASCLKLSGARLGLGDGAQAEALLDEASALLSGLEQGAGLERQPERLQRKHASLAQFAVMMRQQG